MFDARNPGPDYLLRWPRQLFVSEAEALATYTARSEPGWAGQVEWLLEEAFDSDQPKLDFAADAIRPAHEPASGPAMERFTRIAAELTEFQLPKPTQFLLQLIRAADRMPEAFAPRPYFAGRTKTPVRDLAGAQRAWHQFVVDLLDRGYLDRVLPRPCVDDQLDDGEVGDLETIFADRLGVDGLWRRPGSAPWTEDEFFGMVEVVHDVVARPRQRWYHSYNNCGWHTSSFARYPAQVLYRWTVNDLLRRHGVHLELAKSGEDVGRLVQLVDDQRSGLLQRHESGSGDPSSNKVTHAIALFRSRTASTEDKRSACVALAGVLESRRQLLEVELLSRDEGALFQIANQFAIRHQKADQRADYDDAYLDWIFWWYLATVELTNRLLRRTGTGHGE